MKGKARWTAEYLDKLVAQGKIRGWVEVITPRMAEKPPPVVQETRRSKFNARKAEVDGLVFDSQKEARRWQELQVMLKAGVIGLLERQVPYELNPGGTHSLKYVADFVYRIADTGEKIVEDAKGYRTKEYKKKKRLMLQVHNIKINEV